MNSVIIPSLFTGDAADPWLASDKLYHLLFCLFLTIFFSKIASFSRYSFLRRQAVRIGSLLSLSAGAAKEAADQFGFFPSAGASVRDAIADLLGVLIAAFALSFCKTPIRFDPDTSQTRRVLPV
ncbi:hypothetical protein M5689_021318 [Euphorbia peplus]|nr:hypothetical protein M5689_021318 [Euphorbia peplus]